MKKILLSFFLVLLYSQVSAQLVTPFSVRTQFSQKGGIRFIANTSVSCSGGCTGTAQVPPSGTAQNNNFTAAYVDMDGNPSTFMSSSDSLNLPTCSEISWAGLYWSGISNSSQTGYGNRFSVKLKVNNGSYQTITALPANRQDNTVGYTSFHAFADITSIAQAAGANARFTIADLFTETGGMNKWGGWSIVVVYKNDLQPMRNLTVFNGLATVSGSFTTVDVPISGFLTPLSGPVTFDLGVIAYDGDRSQTGDQLLFNGGSGFVNVADAIHTSNDVFNSTISYNGVLTPFRVPSFNNTLGHDANIFLPNNTAKNYIGNSATSATIRVTTGGETILTNVVTSAIDIYEPDLRAAVSVQDLNGGLVEPGDQLEYTILCKNIGSDPSVNTFITDTIEGNATFVPGSIQVFYGPNAGTKTDVTADDQGEYLSASRTVKVRIGTGANGVTGGTVINSPAGNDSTIVKFRVLASTDCVYLQCDNIINNRAYIFGTGNVSGNTFNNGSNPGIFDSNGCPIPGTTASTINSTLCAVPSASNTSPLCEGGSITLNATSSTNAVYSWTGPNGYTSNIQNPTITNATNAMAGTYTVSITIPGISCAFSPTTNVTVPLCSPPVANDDTGAALTEDGANGVVNVLTNDTDSDNGNPTAPTNGAGQFTVDLDPSTPGIQTTFSNASGTWTYNPATGDVTFDPANNFFGTATIPYQLCDPQANCDLANISFTVNPVNDPPVVDDENLTTNEDTPVSGDLTDAGDSDVDGNLVVNTTPTDGPNNGNIVINSNGTYTYTPNPNFSGNDTIVVQICDDGTPLPALCANDTIFISVTPVNDPPVVDDENLTTNEDTPVSGDLTDTGDSDVDGNLVVNTTPTDGPNNGNIIINTDGTYTYTPNPNFNGNDTIVVQICDDGTPLPALCVSDTIFISVTPVNDPPVVDDENITTNEDTPVSGDLTDTGDSDVDGNLVVNTTPTGGPNNGNIVINTDGTYTYTPNTNFNGNDTIVVQVCDDGTPLPALCVSDTIFISVTPVNDPPVVDDENITTNEDTPVSGDLTDTGDTDVDGNLVVNTTPTSGPNNGNIVINTDGTYTYTPNTNFNGNDTIVVQICDDGTPLPALCVSDTIFISVTPVNDPPVVDDENITTNEDTPVSGDLTDTGDSDLDGNLVVNTTPTSGPNNGNIVINTDGTYTYTPNPDFNGNDTIVVEICDDGTPLPALCANDTIFISVTPVNDPPVVDNENLTTAEDTPVSGDLTDTGDTDVDGNLVVNTTPTDGPNNGNIVINSDGTYTYTPNTNFNGNDTIVVQICDNGTPLPAICVSDTIFITVNPCSLADPLADCDDDGVNNGTEGTNGTDPNNPDSDGDGVPDGTELTDGTDGTDPCDLVLSSQTLPPNAAWLSNDCDNDGLTNGEETSGNDDPSTPDNPNGNITNPLDSDSDGDGVTDGQEVLDGTDPNDPCSYLVASVTLPPTSEWLTADCDGDGETNSEEVTDGTDPNNPCDLVVPNQDVTPSSAWALADCDNDGLTNGEEASGNDDPSTPDNPNGNITDPLNPDTDGDGVTDGQESIDGSDPNDPCEFVLASQTVPANAPWNNLDCDNDGLTNGEEASGNDDPSTPDNPNGNITDPLNPDTDGDGVTDGQESIDGTNPNDPCEFVLASQTVPANAPWNNLDCDNDGLTNGEEASGNDDPSTPDNPNGNITDPTDPDTDGDGVTDGQEALDGTNPNDPCSLVLASQTLPVDIQWSNLDCDNDGLTNGEEVSGTDDPSTTANPGGNTTDPANPDTDGDGVTDGNEALDGTDPNDPCSLIVASQSVPATVAWASLDCDNDGVNNGDEVSNGSDPLNECSPVPCGVKIPNAFTPDGDGINDSFVIEGVELYPNNDISIFNRWGDLVFKAEHYQNDWKGTSSNGLNVDGDELPTGTYFYIFNTNEDPNKTLKGYIYIQR